jgi:hypothetical protein
MIWYNISSIKINTPINVESVLPMTVINDILTLNTSSDITPCLSKCSNNGYCVKNTLNEFVCSCFQYFTGSSCSINLNPCKQKKLSCLNNATCEIINLNNSSYDYKCNCPNLYIGRYCENRINVCQNETCSSHGVCLDIDGSPTCKCFLNYFGKTCDAKSEELVVKENAVKATTVIAILIIVIFYFSIFGMDFFKYKIMKTKLI